MTWQKRVSLKKSAHGKAAHLGVGSKSSGREALPEGALVVTTSEHLVGRDNCVTRILEGRAAGLELHAVHHELDSKRVTGLGDLQGVLVVVEALVGRVDRRGEESLLETVLAARQTMSKGNPRGRGDVQHTRSRAQPSQRESPPRLLR